MARSRDVFLEDGNRPHRKLATLAAVVLGLAIFAIGFLVTTYREFVIDVPTRHMAVLIRKTGKDLKNLDEIAPTPEHKGVQLEVLREGRYFFKYDPYNWSWEVLPQVEVPNGKIGVFPACCSRGGTMSTRTCTRLNCMTPWWFPPATRGW